VGFYIYCGVLLVTDIVGRYWRRRLRAIRTSGIWFLERRRIEVDVEVDTEESCGRGLRPYMRRQEGRGAAQWAFDACNAK
jgi:hypothetical protein